MSTDQKRFSCPDWWERLEAGQVPMAEIPLNEDKAARAVVFFERLRLPDVPGTPRLADACGEWFKDIMMAFLASEDPNTKRRLVWELLCMVPKKSSKTTYSAALALTALYLNQVPNGQMLLIGPSQNISMRLFEQAQDMILLDSKLDDIFHITENTKSIKHRTNGTELQVKTFDTGIITGEIPLLTIIDELHVLGRAAKAQAVLQQIRGGGITMNRAQVMFITTQSDKRPAGVWKSELGKARSIRDGLGGDNPIMLPVLYEFPEAQQKDEAYWRNTDNWPLVLPNLGYSIDGQALNDDYVNNGSVSTEAEKIWASQHPNIEMGVGMGLVALAADMSLSFVIFGVFVTAFGATIGLTQDKLAQIGAVLMIVFGVILVVPMFARRFEAATAGIAAGADAQMNQINDSGLKGQFVGGLPLGAVWSPCIGPTLGSAIALASQGENLGFATLIMISFALGVSTLILGLGLGAREAIRTRAQTLRALAERSKPILGITFVAVGLMLYFQIHHIIEAWLLDVMPIWLQDLSVKY